MNIKLSQKHGVNPTIPICFFCNEPKNEIALLGKISTPNDNDAEAPMHALLNYEPCDHCKQILEQGITLIGVKTTPQAQYQPPIQDDLYPTGRYMVVTENAINRLFEPTMASNIINKKRAYVEDELLEELQPKDS